MKQFIDQGVQSPVSPIPTHPLISTLCSHLLHRYEKLTNFGSRGLPSGPIPFFAKRPSVYILLASSKLTLLLFMIFWISRLLVLSRPARESPAATLALRSNAEDEKPFSMSEEKDEGRRE